MSDQPKNREAENTSPPEQQSLSEPLIELVFAIIIPTLVLKKLSGEDMLGPTWALICALSFPLLLGLWGFYKKKRFGFIPVLGFVSILLTGGIGLLKLPKEYIAYKEALVPAILGLITVTSILLKKPIIKSFVMNEALLDLKRIDSAIAARDNTDELGVALTNATWIISLSFVFSSVMNYLIAKWIVVSEPGTEAFNSELGTITLYGYLMIGLPMTIFTVTAGIYVFKKLMALTGLTFEELLRDDLQ